MDRSMARQRYSASRPMRNRRRRAPQRSGGLRKLILFQSLICVLFFLMIIITKNIHMSATDYITAQIKYVLEHDVEPKSTFSNAGKLLADVRDSIFPESGTATKYLDKPSNSLASKDLTTSPKPNTSNDFEAPNNSEASNNPEASDNRLAQALEELPAMEGNLSMSEREVNEGGDDGFILTAEPETTVLSASSDWENDSNQSDLQLLSPVAGTLATDYGQISVGGNVKIHSGIDILVERRSNVKAALDGIVAKTGSSAQYGNYIMIGHGDDLETVYAHCSDILVKTGENVSKGDVIAQVGDDSISVGSHLHFEVWLNGNNVDPLEYISVGDR